MKVKGQIFKNVPRELKFYSCIRQGNLNVLIKKIMSQRVTLKIKNEGQGSNFQNVPRKLKFYSCIRQGVLNILIKKIMSQRVTLKVKMKVKGQIFKMYLES